MINNTLYVIAVISNPRNYKSRYNLYRNFKKYIEYSGAKLLTVELAFGDHDFEITDKNDPFNIQVRSSSELWVKENLIQIGLNNLNRLDPDWKYVAFIDADVTFARPDWVQATLTCLQHYDVIQLFSMCADLGPNHEIFQHRKGFVAKYLEEGFNYGPPDCKNIDEMSDNSSLGHTGYNMGWNRSALEKIGGPYELGIVGSGDRIMWCCIIGEPDASIPDGTCDVNNALSEYKKSIYRWADKAKLLNCNIGYVDGLLLHSYHGHKIKRGYNWRTRILVENSYDPLIDVYKDHQGVLTLSGNKPKLKRDLQNYFASRNEDSLVL